MRYGGLRSHGACRALLRGALRATTAAYAVLGTTTGAVGCASVPPIPQRPEARREFWGFTAPWDQRSARSVAEHAAQLDVVVSGWVALDSTTFRPAVLFPDSFVTRYAGASGRAGGGGSRAPRRW